MTIRKARLSDAEGRAKVAVDTWRTTYKGIVPDATLAGLSYEQSAQRWRESLSKADAATFHFVAEDEDRKIVGLAGAGLCRDPHPPVAGELFAIYVLSASQRRGVGRQLVQAVVREFLSRGISSMRIWVLKDNPYRSFYEKLGGKPADERQIMIGGAPIFERTSATFRVL